MLNPADPAPQQCKTRIRGVWRENKSFIFFLFLIVLFRSAIADWNRVPSGSMLPTIQIGDRILVDKIAYDVHVPLTHIVVARLAEPASGDIVIIDSRAAKERLVKRIVGLPGDRVQLDHNQLIVNGIAAHYSRPGAGTATDDLIEALMNTAHTGTRHQIRLEPVFDEAYSSFGPVTVPANEYLMLGDNRNNSADYRHYGFFTRDEIMGRVRTVAFSLDADRYFLPRWHRFLCRLDTPA